MQLTTGSLWQKWDLHVHTPASYMWNGNERDHHITDDEAREVIEAINARDEIVVFSIQDYWTFDGYIKIRQILDDPNNDLMTDKLILPGMELRVNSPTDFRLNIHVLLSNDFNVEELQIFKSKLQISLANQAESLSRTTLIKLARNYGSDKAKQYGFGDAQTLGDEDLFLLGAKTAVITSESLRDAVNYFNKDRVRVLIMLPYDTYNGVEELAWDKHPAADVFFMSLAHCFEAKNSRNIDCIMHKRTSENSHFIDDFITTMSNVPKPSFRGSDAHRYSDYGTFPNNKITWIRADPTFQGLLQVLNQPDRAYVGKEPSQKIRVRDKSTRYIKSLQITKTDTAPFGEQWFLTDSLEFNYGLVVVLGNKGSGKSALVDILGIAAHSRREQKDYSFLNENKFAKRSSNLAAHFSATISWRDGSITESIFNDFSTDKAEKVLYVPQHFFETICNETEIKTDGAFDRELKKVIFSHIPSEDRLGFANLADLLNHQSSESFVSINHKKDRLQGINREIVKLQAMQSDKYKQELTSKIQELENELRAIQEPEVVEEPVDKPEEATEVENLRINRTNLNSAKAQEGKKLTETNASISAVDQLRQSLNNFQVEFDSFKKQYKPLASILGLNIDNLVKLTVDLDSVHDVSTAIKEKANTHKQEIQSIENQLVLIDEDIHMLEKTLDEGQQDYQEYLTVYKIWEEKQAKITGDPETPDTIEYLRDQLRIINTKLPSQIEQLEDDRKQLVKEIYTSIKDLFGYYEQSMQPVQDYVQGQDLGEAYSNVEFDVHMEMNQQFQAMFLEYIHQGKRGSFQGVDSGSQILVDVLNMHNFDTFDQTWTFISDLFDHLKRDMRTDNPTNMEVEDQLNVAKKLEDLYDFVYSLDYIRPNYVFKLDNKDLIQLSPGERGILLLIFYLLIDLDDRPLIIDQPEENLDNQSIEKLLVPCFKKAKERRQIIIVTHNPNITVGCDADQVIYASMNKDKKEITYVAGAIENPNINATIVEIQEGTWPAFEKRGNTYIRVGR